jgi:hypothetical protein
MTEATLSSSEHLARFKRFYRVYRSLRFSVLHACRYSFVVTWGMRRTYG